MIDFKKKHVNLWCFYAMCKSNLEQDVRFFELLECASNVDGTG